MIYIRMPRHIRSGMLMICGVNEGYVYTGKYLGVYCLCKIGYINNMG